MFTEYVISDFSSAVREKEHLSAKSLPDRWETVPYEMEMISRIYTDIIQYPRFFVKFFLCF